MGEGEGELTADPLPFELLHGYSAEWHADFHYCILSLRAIRLGKMLDVKGEDQERAVLSGGKSPLLLIFYHSPRMQSLSRTCGACSTYWFPNAVG